MDTFIEIEFFGKLADVAGARSTRRALTDSLTVTDLIAQLKQAEPLLGTAIDAPTTIILINDTVSDRAAVLSKGDRLAFLPPVSGG
ncbi:MAG: MoaD/ThiS family protein [Pseudomonadota bacterium]